jgi:hypothetical protein
MMVEPWLSLEMAFSASREQLISTLLTLYRYGCPYHRIETHQGWLFPAYKLVKVCGKDRTLISSYRGFRAFLLGEARATLYLSEEMHWYQKTAEMSWRSDVEILKSVLHLSDKQRARMLISHRDLQGRVELARATLRRQQSARL